MPAPKSVAKKPPHHSRWLESLIITAIVFGLMVGYYRLRGSHLDAFYLNKIAGAVAAALAGLTLLVGPLLSYKPDWKSAIGFRRPLGLLALGFGLLHVVLLLFFLSARFPLNYYQREWIPVGFGLLALCGWVCVAYLSRDSQVMKLGFPKWKLIQNWGGRLAFLFVFLHVTVLKYHSWIQWLTKDPQGPPGLVNSPYPPSSLIVFLVMMSVIVYRGWHLVFGPKKLS